MTRVLILQIPQRPCARSVVLEALNLKHNQVHAIFAYLAMQPMSLDRLLVPVVCLDPFAIFRDVPYAIHAHLVTSQVLQIVHIVVLVQ